MSYNPRIEQLEREAENGGEAGTDALIIKATDKIEESQTGAVYSTDVNDDDFFAAFTFETFRPVYAVFIEEQTSKVLYAMLVKYNGYSEKDSDGTSYSVNYNPISRKVNLEIEYQQ